MPLEQRRHRCAEAFHQAPHAATGGTVRERALWVARADGELRTVGKRLVGRGVIEVEAAGVRRRLRVPEEGLALMELQSSYLQVSARMLLVEMTLDEEREQGYRSSGVEAMPDGVRAALGTREELVLRSLLPVRRVSFFIALSGMIALAATVVTLWPG